jgi:hypothetical protein
MTFPHLKPSTRTISLRLPESMLNELRLIFDSCSEEFLCLQGLAAARRDFGTTSRPPARRPSPGTLDRGG